MSLINYNTLTSFTADGSTNSFTVPCSYIDSEDIHVFIGDTEVTGLTFPTAGTVQLPDSAASLSGSKITIQRITPISGTVTTYRGEGLEPGDLNVSFLQLLYGLQEAQDYISQLLISSASVVVSAIPASLPTTLPPVAGVLWNNNGVVSVS